MHVGDAVVGKRLRQKTDQVVDLAATPEVDEDGGSTTGSNGSTGSLVQRGNDQVIALLGHPG